MTGQPVARPSKHAAGRTPRLTPDRKRRLIRAIRRTEQERKTRYLDAKAAAEGTRVR